MKTVSIIWMFLLVLRGSAFASGNDTDIQVQYPCVGLDGVPLTSGALERQCCVNGKLIVNAPPTCRAGFNSLLGDAVGGVAFNLNIANDTLAVARDLNGVNLNTGSGNRNLSGTGSGSSGGANSPASLSGLVASGSSGFGLGAGAGDSNGMDETMGGRGSRTGLGAGGLAGGAGGGVGAFGGDGSAGGGFAAGTGKAKTDSEDKTGDPAVSGGFRAGQAGGDGADSLNGGWLNAGGSGSEVQGGEGLEEVALGDEELQEGESGQVEGTVVDPSNYFSLIHPKDDLFKIVSRRYTKKWSKMKISAGATRGSRVPASKGPKFTPF